MQPRRSPRKRQNAPRPSEQGKGTAEPTLGVERELLSPQGTAEPTVGGEQGTAEPTLGLERELLSPQGTAEPTVGGEQTVGVEQGIAEPTLGLERELLSPQGTAEPTGTLGGEQGTEVDNLCLTVKKFLHMFTHGKEEQSSAEDAVEQSMDISTHGKEETDIYCSIREVFKQQSKSPMDQASVTVKLVDELENKLPAVACEKWNDLDVKERYFWLQKAFPSWSDIDIANIGASMASIRHSRSFKRLRSSTSSDFSSFREVGLHVLQLAAEENFPKPLDDAIVEEIWPLKDWITEYSPGKSMEEMLKLVKFTDCKFELQDKGHCESVCGKGSKPDLLAVLKGHGSATYSTGAIISLHSKGKASRYDNAESVGEALHYGRTFLKEAGPMRCFIWVAITDLMDITWLKVSVVDGTDGTRQHSYTRSPGTSKVRESLCAFLVSDPSSLGMNVDMQKEFGMSCDWLWKKVLGWGCTSTVHEVEYKSRRYALKVPKDGTRLANDFAYLSILKDVEGVPKIHSKMGEMLVLQPVGYPFSRSTVKSSGLKCSLVQLVDILEAVHSMGVGNRDIRMENMMIADSSHGDKCKERFYILDWGFAAELGFARSFSGCLYTTSDAVLAQIVKKENLVVYNAADDLVAFIRCMFLFFNEDIVAKLVDLREACISHQSLAAVLPAFWGEQMTPNKSWHAIENKAKDCNYDAVRSFLVTAADYI